MKFVHRQSFLATLCGLALLGTGLAQAGDPYGSAADDETSRQHTFILNNATDEPLTLQLLDGWAKPDSVDLAAGASVTLKTAPRDSGTHIMLTMKVLREDKELGTATSTLMDMYYGRGGATVQGRFRKYEFMYRKNTYHGTRLDLEYTPGYKLRTVRSSQELNREVENPKPKRQ